MKIIVEIKEERPGRVVTTVVGVGLATPLESKIVKHVAGLLDTALRSQPSGTTTGRMESKSSPVGNG